MPPAETLSSVASLVSAGFWTVSKPPPPTSVLPLEAASCFMTPSGVCAIAGPAVAASPAHRKHAMQALKGFIDDLCDWLGDGKAQVLVGSGAPRADPTRAPGPSGEESNEIGSFSPRALARFVAA